MHEAIVHLGVKGGASNTAPGLHAGDDLRPVRVQVRGPQAYYPAAGPLTYYGSQHDACAWAPSGAAIRDGIGLLQAVARKEDSTRPLRRYVPRSSTKPCASSAANYALDCECVGQRVEPLPEDFLPMMSYDFVDRTTVQPDHYMCR